jgi:hypothetical protein
VLLLALAVGLDTARVVQTAGYVNSQNRLARGIRQSLPLRDESPDIIAGFGGARAH